MTYQPLDTDRFVLEALLPLHPIPLDPYERALWYQNIASISEQLSTHFADLSQKEIRSILDNRIQSDEYTLATPVQYIDSVNIGILRDQLPRICEQLIHLRAVDAEKILGRPRLYQLANAADPYRTGRLARINLGDLRKALLPAEVPQFITTTTRPGQPCVVSRRNTHVD